MGGAESPKKLKDFLFRMFTDKHIIGAPTAIRYFIAYSISRKRYKSSWKKYEQIGGTPIIKAGQAMAEALATASTVPVEIAFSYSKPFMNDAILKLKSQGAEQITVIPLYPQSSYTTTSSVRFDLNKIEKKHSDIDFKFVQEFYKTDDFIKYWESLIQTHIDELKIEKPTLVFAAHSIPMSVVKKGDTYTQAIKETAKLVAEKMGLPYEVSFQSKFGPVEWYGKDSEDVILDLVKSGAKDIVVAPVSFISECLETIYDIDIELFPDLKPQIPTDVRLSRISMPYAHPLLIETLKNLI